MPEADMLTAIETAALALLNDKVAAVKSSALQKGSNQLLRDIAIAVAVLDGKFRRLVKDTWCSDCTVSVLIKFKNVQSEEARRKGINPLVCLAVQSLLGQKLGLDITRLEPLGFRDVTSEDKYAAGVIEYLLEFATSYDIVKLPEEDLGDLVTIAIDYFLQDPADDELADGSDTITTA